MCPQVELGPVSMAGAPLDVSLTSRWPLLTRLCLHGTDYSSTVEAVLTTSGVEVTVRSPGGDPTDTREQLQGLLDGFIRLRWGRAQLVGSLEP
jgi:hypothetical protein